MDMTAIRDVMTAEAVTVSAEDPILRAAEVMRQEDVGDVFVIDAQGDLCGIVTDRDITVRAVADGQDPVSTKVDAICSHDLVTVSPDDSVDQAIRLMRERAIRRMPVIEGGRVVGALSIGDLAVQQDPDSALADISASPPNE
jgi:CBS domain-containing protein